jgi:glycosyltransferase involved in cell wall biosynthesis
VPHGVDLDRFAPAATVAAPAPHVRLLAVGRLVEKKGFSTLLEALALLADIDLDLTIVGDGPDRAALESQIARLGLGNRVTLRGRATHAELPGSYCDAEVVVVPSVVDSRGDRDGLPNVVLEAMACGRPIVASDVAAIASAITSEVDGVLVAPADAGALADAIRAVASDPLRRDALGAAARHTAEQRFELDRCSRRFSELLTDAYASVATGGTRA